MNVERWKIDDRAVWLEWRKGFLCGSEIAAAAGVDDYCSALELFLVKTGQILPQAENAAMRRGRLYEVAALEYVAEEFAGCRIVRPNIFLVAKAERIAATPDALIEVDPVTLVNCQVKVISRPVFESWPLDAKGEPEPPLGYRLQLAMENMLLGVGLGYLAVLVVSDYATDDDLYLFDQPRHERLEARILEIAADFWQRVRDGRPYAADYERDERIIKRRWPPSKSVPTPLDLSTDNRIGAVLEEYEQVKATIAAAKKREKTLETEITDKLKGAELALAPGWRITRKMVPRREYVVPATEYPRLYVSRRKSA